MQRQVAEAAAGHAGGVRRVAAGRRLGCVEAAPSVGEFVGQGLEHLVAGGDHRLHFHPFELLKDIAFRGHRQHLPQHGAGFRILGLLRLRNQIAKQIKHQLAHRRAAANKVQFAEQQALHGVPTGEAVAVVAGQKGQGGGGARITHPHWGGEAAQEAQLRRFVQTAHLQAGLRLPQMQQQTGAAPLDLRIALQVQAGARQVAPVHVQQAEQHWDVHGLLVRLPRRRRAALPDVDVEGAVPPSALHAEQRGAGLGVPKPKLPQIGVVGVLHRLHEVLGGDGLAVVAVKVEVGAFAEALPSDQALRHAHHLGALLIDRGGVEVGYLNVGVRAHRMRQGAAVLGELHGAQQVDVLNALDRARVHVGTELRVPKHGEALLEAELEPVPAGHPVAGPVVEVFMGDDRLHPLVGGIHRGVRGGEHTGGVEDVEALVLHRPHVEVLHRHDHVDVQVVLAPERLLVPAHGPLQGAQGVLALADVVRLRVDAQLHAAPALGGEVTLHAG